MPAAAPRGRSAAQCDLSNRMGQVCHTRAPVWWRLLWAQFLCQGGQRLSVWSAPQEGKLALLSPTESTTAPMPLRFASMLWTCGTGAHIAVGRTVSGHGSGIKIDGERGALELTRRFHAMSLLKTRKILVIRRQIVQSQLHQEISCSSRWISSFHHQATYFSVFREPTIRLWIE